MIIITTEKIESEEIIKLIPSQDKLAKLIEENSEMKDVDVKDYTFDKIKELVGGHVGIQSFLELTFVFDEDAKMKSKPENYGVYYYMRNLCMLTGSLMPNWSLAGVVVVLDKKEKNKIFK